MKKETLYTWGGTILFVVLIAGGLYLFSNSGSKDEEPEKPVRATTTVTTEVTTETTETLETTEGMTEEPKSEAEKEIDTKVLEDTPAPEEIRSQAEEASKIAIEAAKADKMELTAKEENRLAMTHSSMVNTLAMAVAFNHFDYQEVKVFMSPDKDVYQFTLHTVDQSGHDLFFTGFYSQGQLRLTEYTGGPIGGTFG